MSKKRSLSPHSTELSTALEALEGPKRASAAPGEGLSLTTNCEPVENAGAQPQPHSLTHRVPQVHAVLLLQDVPILPCLQDGSPTRALAQSQCVTCVCRAHELRMVFKSING